MNFVRLAVVISFLCFIGCPAYCTDRDRSSLSLVLTFHTAPVNRAGFRKELEETVLREFEQMRQGSTLQAYTVLFSRYVDDAGWDAMILATFSNEAGLAAWKNLEESAPAGLSAKALSLITNINTAPADLIQDKAAAQGQNSPVFLVIPYEIAVPGDEYTAYLSGYVVPQLDGWMGEGILVRYRIYLARYPAGRPWQSLLVLEYKSQEALGSREATVAKVRARLKENAEWKALSDNKKTIRVEKAATIADPLYQGSTNSRH